MRHSQTYTLLCKFLLPVRALLLASCLVFFGAANGLASQPVYAMRVLRAQLVGGAYPNLTSNKPMYYYYYIGNKPSYYEAFPFLQELNRRVQNNGSLIDYVPYGTFPVGNNNNRLYPFFYREYADILAGSVPDDWTSDDIKLLNDSYNDLSAAEKNAITGTFVAGFSQNGETTTKFFQFNQSTAGTIAYNGGVYTYNAAGEVVVSFPDNTGYISGYKPLPDGTFTPVYYTVDNGVVTEVEHVDVSVYDALEYDSDLGHYTLNVPDYRNHLDKIINKLDTINSQSSVTINPDVTVNVPTTDLTNIEASLEDVLSTQVIDDYTVTGLSTNDFSLTTEDENLISNYRDWETNIPLLGNTLDFGLTTILGRIPNIGTEYVWLDHTIGGSKSRSFSSNPLEGFRLFISLESYRGVLLALRGWLILFEALYFIILTYRSIREALKV